LLEPPSKEREHQIVIRKDGNRVAIKPFFILSVMVFVCIVAYAQRSNSVYNTKEDSIAPIKVPNHILNSFKKKYPGIEPDFWLKDGIDYEAQFSQKGKIKTAEFDKRGQWLNAETILEVNDVPEKSIDYIRSQYPAYEPDIVILEESPMGKFITVGIVNDEDYQELIFDTIGNFLYVAEFTD
jgi:hypothetical protein